MVVSIAGENRGIEFKNIFLLFSQTELRMMGKVEKVDSHSPSAGA